MVWQGIRGWLGEETTAMMLAASMPPNCIMYGAARMRSLESLRLPPLHLPHHHLHHRRRLHRRRRRRRRRHHHHRRRRRRHLPHPLPHLHRPRHRRRRLRLRHHLLRHRHRRIRHRLRHRHRRPFPSSKRRIIDALSSAGRSIRRSAYVEDQMKVWAAACTRRRGPRLLPDVMNMALGCAPGRSWQ